MDEKKAHLIDGDDLRRQAEDRIGENSGTTPLIGPVEAQRNLHELEVHQIELEMQNAELLQTRERLEATLQKYQNLFDFAPIGYLILNCDGAIQDVNLSGASLLGFEKSYLLGRSFGLFVAEEYRSAVAGLLHTVSTSKSSTSCEIMLLNSESVPLFVQIEANPDQAGQECRLALIDISKRKAAERKLRESERIYRAIGESIDYGVWICAPDGRNIYASDSFLNLVGITQEQCSNFGWGEVLHPDDSERTIDAWKECVSSECNWDIEHRFRGVDGQWHHVLARGVPVRDDHGEITCWAGINLDISRIKVAEKNLRENEARLRLAQESANVGVWDWRAGTGTVAVTPELNKLYGLPPGTIKTYQDWRDRVHPDDIATVETLRDEAIAKHEPFDLVFRGIHSSGEYRWIETKGGAVYDDAGQPVRVFGVNIDITGRKQAEEALKQLNDELEERVTQRTEELRAKDEMLLLQSRQAAMGEMIGNIAHQWRQPLNVLGLTVQSLVMHYDLGEFTGEFLIESVDSSMEIIQHMSRTIDDFRNYFRPDKEKSPFRLSEAINNTISLIQSSFNYEEITIEVTIENDPAINGYPNEFAQVILNILNNARDALVEKNVENPRVAITIAMENGRAVVTISDNAGGIPEEIIEKIFDPYFTTKGPQAGTGVGLFMSKSIIEKNMNGRITARNTADGAQFRIEV